jgi:hypothetical protein
MHFVMVHNSFPTNNEFPSMHGPFESDESAREWAEENFPRKVWMVTEPE